MAENNGTGELSIRPLTAGVKARVEVLGLENLHRLRMCIIGHKRLVLIA